jgi:PAS domain S-box-containing protein
MLSQLGEPDAWVNRCLRDLVALSTLPAIWSGADLIRIGESLAASLFTTLVPDFVYICITNGEEAPSVAVAQTDRYETSPALAERIGPPILDWARTHDPDEVFVLPNPRDGGPVPVATRLLQLRGQVGVLAAGFTDGDAPTALHHILLTVAACQASSAIQHTFLVRELRSSEARLRESNAALGERIAELQRANEEIRDARRAALNVMADAVQTKDALRESEERFRTLADHMSQFAWMVNECGETVWFNRRWYEYTGTMPMQMQGEGWVLVHHPDHKERVVTSWRRAFASGEPWEETFPLRGANGHYRWFLTRAIPIRDPQGTIVRWFGTNTDITELRDAEHALRQAQQRLQQWNSELEQAVLLKTAELTQSQDKLRALASELNLAEQRERKRLATELHDHLQQLLVLGKIEIGQGKRHTKGLPECDRLIKKVDGILSEALNYTRTLVAELSPPVLRDHGLNAGLKWLAEYMQKYNLVVTVTVPDNGGMIVPEDQAVLLFQSVRELLMNSWKHGGAGRAHVVIQYLDRELRICVQDEGRGFDPSAVAGARDSALSSGFGLFSIKERMRALGGSFDIQSEVGKGTSATLTVPTVAGDTPDGSRGAKTESKTKGHPPSMISERVSGAVQATNWRTRVLLVDDHMMVRQGLRSVLEQYADIELVGEASNGEEAVAAVGLLRPAVVVMDLNMPKKNGIEATAEIKLHYPDVHVIGLSVNAGNDNEASILKAGAAILLTKEAAVEHLYGAIRQMVEKRPVRASIS